MSITSDKISGKAKRVVGSITNNKELEAKGVLEETKGKVKSNLKHTPRK
ncbi:CsbD family protein [Candidatus Saccharibacteria bacterium]|nr:CsbD family protein [Candidatus Saccharibacteria bacterium]